MQRAPNVPLEAAANGSPVEEAVDRLGRACRLWWTRAASIDLRSETSLVGRPHLMPTCEVILANRILNLAGPATCDALAQTLANQQHADGTWHDAEHRPCLSTTVMATWALRQVPQVSPPVDPALTHRRIEGLGGAQRACFSTRTWLAMTGAIPWSWLPTIMSEVWLFPPHSRLSPRRLPAWSREMTLAFHVLSQARTRLHLVPADDLVAHDHDGRPMPPRLPAPGAVGDALVLLERSIRVARRLHPAAMRAAGTSRALEWIRGSQQSHGGWMTARSTLWSMLALRAAGARTDAPALVAARGRLAVLRGAFDAASSATPGAPPALAQHDAGPRTVERARLARAMDDDARRALLDDEIDCPGPWQRTANAPTGGWSYEPSALVHLDVDATCVALEALRDLDQGHLHRAWASRRRAARVLLAMQLPDGSFPRFDRAERGHPLMRLPWRDASALGATHGTIATRVARTARVLEQLGTLGLSPADDRLERGTAWLVRACDGTDVHATWSVQVLAAVSRALSSRLPRTHETRQKIEQTLRRRQREDGGFGDLRETAHALEALSREAGPCVQANRAATHLVDAVRRASDPARLAPSPDVQRGPGDATTNAWSFAAQTADVTSALQRYQRAT